MEESVEKSQPEADLVSVLHSNLELEFKDVDADALSKRGVFWFHVPSLTRDELNFPKESFQFVGRSWFRKLHDFVTGLMKPEGGVQQGFVLPDSKRLKPTAEQKKEVDELLARERKLQSEVTVGLLDRALGSSAYILGTPGEGKTYAVAALAGLLHVAVNDFATVYICARRFVHAPYSVLLKALLLAFCGDASIVATLKGFAGQKSLLDWVGTLRKTLFLVDDNNELDEEQRKEAVTTPAQRAHARAILHGFSMQHVVVFFCSSCSKCRLPLTKEPHPPYMLIAGGFSDAELNTFSLVESVIITEDDLEKTGKNPRLLQRLLQGEVHACLKELEGDLSEFLERLTASELSDFMLSLAGGPITRLPRAMDSRCFFPENGTLVAISSYLLSAAYSKCVELCHENAREERIRYFIAAVKNDSSDMTRIGWNAEEATLLVLGSQTINIRLEEKLCWMFKASRVCRFRGGITAVNWLGTGDAAFHLPMQFNCRAVDCMLEGVVDGKRVAAGVQISVSKDPQGSHEGPIQHFCNTMATCEVHYDVLAFIWIGYFPENMAPMEIMVGNQKLTEVTLSFGSVHRLLKVVDAVLKGIRAAQVQTKERVRCTVHKSGKTQCQNTVAAAGGSALCHSHQGEKRRKQAIGTHQY